TKENYSTTRWEDEVQRQQVDGWSLNGDIDLILLYRLWRIWRLFILLLRERPLAYIKVAERRSRQLVGGIHVDR
ncbi:hypothetical protein ABFV48_26975, partial [Pseudomonas syringae]|uniref:hypothetical protein n=1 Tax=Pseudomonas syringae TaxID=317 RepID=UPI0034D97325